MFQRILTLVISKIANKFFKGKKIIRQNFDVANIKYKKKTMDFILKLIIRTSVTKDRKFSVIRTVFISSAWFYCVGWAAGRE